ncbi:hypothetical protein PPACK8108_LOCUS23909 [Phakopsora pachyrhizi]|uniref:Uncharacterized protein n=1 Tax=Phakopsora pachyrhizi TaxID=170000 RepID=A0AAV0BPC1_PHAPC|nr:hypothetical protein PPACK8108_LOCUS23909 [Phakopsora pachyrhizi]
MRSIINPVRSLKTHSSSTTTDQISSTQQNFLSDSKSEGMINYSPVLTQDEKLNLTTYLLIINTIVLLSRTKSETLFLKPTETQQPQTSLVSPGKHLQLNPTDPSNQTIDPESINHQSESTTVSILSSQQMTVVNLQSNLQHSSPSSLPVSLRLPLSPTTSRRPTPKPKSTNTTKPTAIRPHTPDLTNSRPKSPSQINLANLVENWGGGGPSELSYRLPDPPSPISAFEINLSTQSNNSQSSLNCSLNQDQRCPMYHQPKNQAVDPKPLPNHNLPQHTVTIQALPPSEHPESKRSNTPGSKLEIECKDEEDDDVLGNEELYSAQMHLSTKYEILPISGPLRENLDLVKLREIWIGAMFQPAIVHLKCLFLIRLARLSKLVHQKITILIGDITRERGRESAKAQKSGGSKTIEMVRIIKEQALKFEEERHWLTSKLVKLTSSNQVLERGRM